MPGELVLLHILSGMGTAASLDQRSVAEQPLHRAGSAKSLRSARFVFKREKQPVQCLQLLFQPLLQPLISRVLSHLQLRPIYRNLCVVPG